jgi:hypothetical protein
VIAAPILTRGLENVKVGRPFNDAYDGAAAPFVPADGAELALGEVSASIAKSDALLDLHERFGKTADLLPVHIQYRERQPARRFFAHSRQFLEVVYKGLEQRKAVIHYQFSLLAKTLPYPAVAAKRMEIG